VITLHPGKTLSSLYTLGMFVTLVGFVVSVVQNSWTIDQPWI